MYNINKSIKNKNMSLHTCNLDRDGIDTDVLHSLPIQLIKKLAAKSSIKVDTYNNALKHAMKAKAGVEGKRLRDFIMEVPGIEAHIIRIEKMKDGGGLDIRELNTSNPVGVYSNHNANNRTTIASSIKPLKQAGGSIMNDFGKEFAIVPKNQGTEMNNMKYLQNYIQTSTLGGKYKKGGKTNWKRVPADQIFMVGGKMKKYQSGGEQGWSPSDDKPVVVNGVELTKKQAFLHHTLKKDNPGISILWGQDNFGNWGKHFFDSNGEFLSTLDGASEDVELTPETEYVEDSFLTDEDWDNAESIDEEPTKVEPTATPKPTRQAPTRQLKKAKPVDLSTMEEHEGYMVDDATKKVYTMDGKLVTDTTFANNLLATFRPKQEVMTLPEKEYDLQEGATANLISNVVSTGVRNQENMKDKITRQLNTPVTEPEDTRTQTGRLKQGVNKVLFGKAAQGLTGLFRRNDERAEKREEKKALRKINRSK